MTNEIVPQEASIDQILQGPEGDLLKRCVERMLAQAMETEVTSQIGATLHERADGRLAYRNGYREREFETRVGSLTLAIPKLRSGTFFPSFLEPRRRAER
jgi:transposase-like protein